MSDKTEQQYQKLLAELNKILTERTDAATGERIALRDAVCAYVFAERASGTTIDHVVHAVDAILGEAEEAVAKGADGVRRRDHALASQLVYWCLEFGSTRGGGETLA